MGSESTRRFKVEWIRDKITQFFDKKPKDTISKSKLIAQFALQTFSTQRTGVEIISLLADTGFIKLKGDVISK